MGRFLNQTLHYQGLVVANKPNKILIEQGDSFSTLSSLWWWVSIPHPSELSSNTICCLIEDILDLHFVELVGRGVEIPSSKLQSTPVTSWAIWSDGSEVYWMIHKTKPKFVRKSVYSWLPNSMVVWPLNLFDQALNISELFSLENPVSFTVMYPLDLNTLMTAWAIW